MRCVMRGRKRESAFYPAMAAIPMVLLVIVFLLPLSFNLARAFFNEDGFTLSNVKEVISTPYTYRLLSFTLMQAALSSLVSVLVALPGAYLYANYRFRLKRLMLSLSSLCFVLPSILVVLGFVIFYGNSGFVNDIWRTITGREEAIRILYSFKAIILAHAFLNIPVALTLITEDWAHTPRSQENASYLLGSSKLHTFLTITLPRIMPTVLSAALLIFLFCFTSFSIILVLGGGPQYTTLEVEIYRTNNIVMDSAKASALSLFSFLVNLVILVLYMAVSRNAASREKSRDDRAVRPTSWKTKAALALYNTLMLIFMLGPLVSILARSVISTSSRYKEGFSLRSFAELFGLQRSVGVMSDAFQALVNSLVIALVVALLSTVMALFLCLYTTRRRSKAVEVVGMFPLAISSVPLGLGYYIIRAHIHSSGVLAGYILVILAHLVIAMPFAMRTISPVMRSGNPRILDAAYTLGASVSRTCFGVEIPMLKTTLARAFIFSFALSVGEVNATLTLAEGKVVTLPILLYRLINSYNYQGACAIGSVLMVMTFIIFALAQAMGTRRSNGNS